MPSSNRNLMSYSLACLALLLGTAEAWQLWSTSGQGPPSRDGHSLVLYNNTVFMFGGRGSEVTRVHTPMTFDIVNINGTLSFSTYDGKPIKDCGSLSFHECYDIMVGTYYNDLWAYPLDCERTGWDTGCKYNADDKTAGWIELSPFVYMGGCTIKAQVEVCTNPQERFGHAAAVFDSGRMYVYGGFSRLCEDYCADMWMFDVGSCMTATLEARVANSNESLWGPTPPDPSDPYDTVAAATRAAAAAAHAKQVCMFQSIQRSGDSQPSPGRRWKFASAHDRKRWVMFGGHRLWHGFSPANTLYNKWTVRDPQGSGARYEYGGFLDDLWVYIEPEMESKGGAGSSSSMVNATTTGAAGSNSNTTTGAGDGTADSDLMNSNQGYVKRSGWVQVKPLESCYRNKVRVVDGDWDARNDIVCTVHWPEARADAAMALHGEYAFLHGGYRTPYPYPHVLGPGAGVGVAPLTGESYSPFPTHPYFMSDIWRYSLRKGTWQEIKPLGDEMPAPRRAHILVSLSLTSSLLMFGGYGGNKFFDDTWEFRVPKETSASESSSGTGGVKYDNTGYVVGGSGHASAPVSILCCPTIAPPTSSPRLQIQSRVADPKR